MFKKKQLVIIGIVALLVCTGLSGCLENQVLENQVPVPLSEEEKFYGVWNFISGKSFLFLGNINTFNFYRDGNLNKCTMTGGAFSRTSNYLISGNQMIFEAIDPSDQAMNTLVLEYYFLSTNTVKFSMRGEIIGTYEKQGTYHENQSNSLTTKTFLGKWDIIAFDEIQGTYEFTDNQVIIIDNGKQSTHDWILYQNTRVFSVKYDNEWLDYHITNITENTIEFQRNGYAFFFIKTTL
jgi:hypothetical protein